MPNKRFSNPKFSSTLGFIAAAASSAVGLGSIWRFPYEVGAHGGAAFLLLYFVFTLVLGLPMMLLETTFGRARQGGMHVAFFGSRGGVWLGRITVMGVLLYMSCYNVIIGWLIGYVRHLATGVLLQQADMQVFYRAFIADLPSNVLCTLLVTVVSAVVVRAGVQQGIERAAKLLIPLFVLLFVGLIGYALTFSRAMEGVKFYLLPRFDALTLPGVSAALALSFMTLGISQGSLITYGAYLPRHTNLTQSAGIIVISVLTIAFLAGLLIFPLTFSQGVPPQAGPGLVFILLPYLFQQLGSGGAVLGVLFFVLLIFAAITSSLALLEVVVNYAIERWRLSRQQAVWGAAGLSMLLSMPSLASFGGIALLSHCATLQGKGYGVMELLQFGVVDILFPLLAIGLSLLMTRRWVDYGMVKALQQGASPAAWWLTYLRYVARYLAPMVVWSVLLMTLWPWCRMVFQGSSVMQVVLWGLTCGVAAERLVFPPSYPNFAVRGWHYVLAMGGSVGLWNFLNSLAVYVKQVYPIPHGLVLMSFACLLLTQLLCEAYLGFWMCLSSRLRAAWIVRGLGWVVMWSKCYLAPMLTLLCAAMQHAGYGLLWLLLWGYVRWSRVVQD